MDSVERRNPQAKKRVLTSKKKKFDGRLGLPDVANAEPASVRSLVGSLGGLTRHVPPYPYLPLYFLALSATAPIDWASWRFPPPFFFQLVLCLPVILLDS
jgi:hypothetical protein